jgi:hypothetical protein
MLLKRTSSSHLSYVRTVYSVLDFDIYDLIDCPVSLTVPKQSQYTAPFKTQPTSTTKFTKISIISSRSWIYIFTVFTDSLKTHRPVNLIEYVCICTFYLFNYLFIDHAPLLWINTT